LAVIEPAIEDGVEPVTQFNIADDTFGLGEVDRRALAYRKALPVDDGVLARLVMLRWVALVCEIADIAGGDAATGRAASAQARVGTARAQPMAVSQQRAHRK